MGFSSVAGAEFVRERTIDAEKIHRRRRGCQ
jgi:hypothetical protein